MTLSKQIKTLLESFIEDLEHLSETWKGDFCALCLFDGDMKNVPLTKLGNGKIPICERCISDIYQYYMNHIKIHDLDKYDIE